MVFGKATGFAADLDLSSLNGTNGFKLSGAAAYDNSGFSVASAGDVNGDGLADLIIGTGQANDPAEASYVVFGKATGFAANIDLSSLDGSNGFKLSGDPHLDASGFSVASAGDINHDGFSDLIVGAFTANVSYIVFGRKPDVAVNRTGTDAAETLAGGEFADTLSGLGGNDTLYGHGGNDVLDGGTGDDTMIGDVGNDIYFVDTAGDKVIEQANGGIDTVDATLNTYKLGANVERVTFTGSGNFAGAGNDLDNRLAGGAGDDRFVTSAGADVYGGGSGTDAVDYRTATTGAVLNFATSVFGGAAAGDVFGSIEKFFGSDTAADTMTGGGTTGRFSFSGFGGNDTLTGGGSIDQLSGGAGNDTLSGLAGRDSLDGGAGNDTMTGGAGADLFVYSAASFGKDTIGDFEDGLDRFKVNSSVAYAIGDYTITNNGSANVTLALVADPTQTIAIHGSGGSSLTITAADFVFY